MEFDKVFWSLGRGCPDEVDDIPSGHLVMDGPKKITAKWKDDFTIVSAIAASIETAYTASLVVLKKEITRKTIKRVINIRKKPVIKGIKRYRLIN